MIRVPQFGNCRSAGADPDKRDISAGSHPPRPQHRLDRAQCAECRVGGVHLGRDCAAPRQFAEHVVCLLARTRDEILGKSREPHFVLVHERGEGLRIELLHDGLRVVCFRGAGMRDDPLEFVGEHIPAFQGDDALAGAGSVW
jgi:hypothetical protein